MCINNSGQNETAYLEKPAAHARIHLADLSSAFNVISWQINTLMILILQISSAWIVGFLSCHRQWFCEWEMF